MEFQLQLARRSLQTDLSALPVCPLVVRSSEFRVYAVGQPLTPVCPLVVRSSEFPRMEFQLQLARRPLSAHLSASPCLSACRAIVRVPHLCGPFFRFLSHLSRFAFIRVSFGLRHSGFGFDSSFVSPPGKRNFRSAPTDKPSSNHIELTALSHSCCIAQCATAVRCFCWNQPLATMAVFQFTTTRFKRGILPFPQAFVSFVRL
jgi:hypothetical protein